MRREVLHKVILAMLLLSSLSARSQTPVASNSAEFPSRFSLESFARFNVEGRAIVLAGSKCGMFSKAEVAYLNNLQTFIAEAYLPQDLHKQLIAEELKYANLDYLEKRVDALTEGSCLSKELAARVNELRTRVRIAGHFLKQLDESHTAAVVDLFLNSSK